MTHTFSIANQKGGVGKTTTTFHLAGAAAKRGLRTLVIDGDPQGNLTSSLDTGELTASSIGLADALSRNADETLADVIVPTQWEGVDLVPTTGGTLSAVEHELNTMSLGRTHRLSEELESVKGRYDLVLIDCPPNLGPLTINAFVASEQIVVVAKPELWSGTGLLSLFTTMQEVRRYCARPDLRFAGVIFNMYDNRETEQAKRYREITEAAEKMEIPILHPTVPRRVTVFETAIHGTRLDLSSDPRAAALAPIYDRHLEALLASTTDPS
ncbi:ParA family protein [Streptomyces rishiriensis]|uniref:ParA family protein n=1 Tax=Streptomyces rishiriensis TaxID=68264 RepID=UPI0037BC2168